MVQTNAQLTADELNNADAVGQWLASLGQKHTPEESETIWQAVKLARSAHEGQLRASGEPYLNHAIAVADILVQLRMDSSAITAAILHDVVEDSSISLEDIEQQFGHDVAQLVDGVTKMRIIDLGARPDDHKENLQAESLRKLLLAMAEDVRVVLIKLADRLHNMRTLKHLPESKRLRIARETLDIYAPLANRLGIWNIKWELEDLSFRFLDADAYKQIARFLDERRVDREQYIELAKTILTKELENAGVKADIQGRPKHIYSIWKKMQRKGLNFHDLYDVRAIRLLVDEKKDCYAALGVVHGLWRHIPKEFDDYIATPKENNYQSIHTAVIGPNGKTLEVQIRTSNMHDHAELGVAAHWRYKEGAQQSSAYDQKIAWLRQLLEWREESDDAGDFIDRFKSEVFQDRVYVLTPNGDVIDLPQGSTPLDFAYLIHTEVGHRCRGARVNGKMVSLTYELKSGEQVEVLTTRHSRPSRDWINPHLGYLKTNRARAKVRAWLKTQDHEVNVNSGRTALEKELHRLGVGNINHRALSEHLKYSELEDFLAALGRGDITSAQIANAVQRLTSSENNNELPVGLPRPRTQTLKPESDEVSIEGVGNLMHQMANCCKPVPGDDIIGFITMGRGVTVHRKDCHNILKMDESKRTRLISVEWGKQTGGHPVDICVETIDRQGLLKDILTILSNEHINVLAVNTESNQSDHTAQMKFKLEISDVSQLSRVLNKIGQLNNVMEVRREQQ
ncbi:MAG: GTP diphosphokinase [Gammaproteobacteria bacterium]|nr:GTP diphosphokinase [Gammaproteobacteria bacterium]